MKKLTIEEVKERARGIGTWEVLDDIYNGSDIKLNCKCIKSGHIYKISWDKIKQETGCVVCYKAAKRLHIDYVKAKSIKLGKWVVLSTVFDNCKTKLHCVCSKCGYHNYISWNGIQRGAGCPMCYYDSLKLTLEYVVNEAEKFSVWKIIDNTYIDAHSHLKCQCRICGYKNKVTWACIQAGGGCPKCNSINTSLFEKTVRDFLAESNIDYVSNDRTQLINPNTNRNLELDMWFPDLNKAIECNGIYWHGKKRAIKNDKIKKQLCKDQNIDLLVITDKEWNKDTDKCKAKIKNFVVGE